MTAHRLVRLVLSVLTSGAIIGVVTAILQINSLTWWQYVGFIIAVILASDIADHIDKANR